jgi:ribosomal protein S18 acetylase RimI-like enzyme
MEIIVSNAQMNDLMEIQALNLMLFEKEHKEYDKFLNLNWTFSKEGIKYFKDKITKKDNCLFVAKLDGKIVGYLAGSLTKAEAYRNLPKVAELNDTLVLEGNRSLGIGTKLYNEFMKWCKKQNVKIIRVQASAQNERAIKFYRKNGFKDYTLILENYL